MRSKYPEKLTLASGSPRRRDLLQEMGYDFEIIVPHAEAECGVCSGESPPELVARLAYQKASDVCQRIQSGTVVACDTVVECCGQILGKPVDAEDARRMLKLLSGREHRVYSGLCVWKYPEQSPHLRVACSVLRMKPLADGEINEHVDSDAWVGKAGGFGYQDGLEWLEFIQGSESNVVGLPMELLAEILAEL